MPDGLLGAIINPAQADVLGALDVGRKRQGRDLAGQILGETQTGKLGRLLNLDPDLGQKLAASQGIPLESKGRQDAWVGTIVLADKLSQGGDPGGAIAVIEDYIGKVQGATQGQELAQNAQAHLDKMKAGDPEAFKILNQLASAFTKGTEKKGAGQVEFESKLEGLSEEDREKAIRVDLGLDPRAVGSAVQTIANEGIANTIAVTQETIKGGEETGKLKARLKLKPAIEAAITRARAEATAKGETLTDLKRAEAALPGLTDTIGQLKDLAPIVTSTIGGRLFDAAIKESGFGSTTGANARAKFVAIINNQVLPLLRQTFGAAFTEREGETLKATMGDPDASPEQKILQLESFIDQKVRNIQASQRELGREVTPATDLSAPTESTTGNVVLRFDAQGNQL